MLKTLLGIRFSSFAASLMGKGERKLGKTVLFALLYLYVLVVFVGFSVLMAIVTGSSMISLGLGPHFLALFLLVDFAILFIMSIFETKSELFDCKDNELILSMPIPPSLILLSRTLTVLIYNLAASVIIMLPAAIVYLLLLGDALGFCGTLLFMIIVPALATALASAFGYIIAYISKRTRHATLISVLFTLLFMGVYFYFYMQMMSGGDEFFENPDAIVSALGNSMPILVWLGNAITFKLPELLIFVLCAIVVCAAAYMVLSKFYMRIATYSGVSSRAVYRAERARVESKLFAFMKKEYSKILSSSLYLTNAGLGIVFRIAIGVIALIKMTELRSALSMLYIELGIGSYDSFVAVLIALVMVISSSMDMFSASAVSLEGKSLWIVKSMPISPATVLGAKTLAHASISSVASLLSAALMLVAVGGGIIPWLVAIFMALLTSVDFAMFGTVINVALPKLDFENEAQPIKQSLAVFIVMFGQMLWGFWLILPSIFGTLFLGGYITALIILLLHAIVGAILYLIHSKVSVPRFANL